MEVDMATFQVLGTNYAKDDKNAYFKHKVINAPIDIPTFRAKSGFIPVDKNHVYIAQYIDTSNSNSEAYSIFPAM